MRPASFLVLLLLGTASSAATLYISDELTVPLRRGPTTGHRIIHAGLPAGMALQVLGEDKASGFTQVRTPNGTEGWVQTQYLTSQPVAKDLLAAANKRVQALEAQLQSVKGDFQEMRGARAQAESRNNDLDKQTRQLQNELAEIRRVSATALTQYQENKTLKTENERLRSQITELGGKLERLQRGTQLHWLLGGGALVLLGLVLGAWIKSRPKRSSWT